MVPSYSVYQRFEENRTYDWSLFKFASCKGYLRNMEVRLKSQHVFSKDKGIYMHLGFSICLSIHALTKESYTKPLKELILETRKPLSLL